MNTRLYSDLVDAIALDLDLDPSNSNSWTTKDKTDTAMLVSKAMDHVWHWMDSGWPELREVQTLTAADYVVSKERATGKLPVGTVLRVTLEDPRSSRNPQEVVWSEYAAGIVLDPQDAAEDQEVYVTFLRLPPKFTATAWATGTDYTVGQVRQQDGRCYECITAHTSGTFATDLAANKWEEQLLPAFAFSAVQDAVVAAWREKASETTRSSVLRQRLQTSLDELAMRLAVNTRNRQPGQTFSRSPATF